MRKRPLPQAGSNSLGQLAGSVRSHRPPGSIICDHQADHVGRGEELPALRLQHAGRDLLVGRTLDVHVGLQQVVPAQFTDGVRQHAIIQVDLSRSVKTLA